MIEHANKQIAVLEDFVDILHREGYLTLDSAREVQLRMPGLHRLMGIKKRSLREHLSGKPISELYALEARERSE